MNLDTLVLFILNFQSDSKEHQALGRFHHISDGIPHQKWPLPATR